jgi:hypothetical protein
MASEGSSMASEGSSMASGGSSMASEGSSMASGGSSVASERRIGSRRGVSPVRRARLPMRHPAAFASLAALAGLVLAAPARADEPAEEPRADFMRALASRGLHDLRDERWNAYGQISLIGHGKPSFEAKYTNLNADRSLSFGALAKGSYWRRPGDALGVGAAVSWISGAHAAYLNAGGIDGFLGDGRINQAAEATIEVFYSFRVLAPLWLSLDYQHVVHPAYNAERGPVDLAGARLHAELRA